MSMSYIGNPHNGIDKKRHINYLKFVISKSETVSGLDRTGDLARVKRT